MDEISKNQSKMDPIPRQSMLFISGPVAKVQALHNILVDVAMKFSRSNQRLSRTLFFTRNKNHKMDVQVSDHFDDTLKRIFFVYVDTTDLLIHTILDLQRWQNFKSGLIIVDYGSFTPSCLNASLNTKHFQLQQCLLLAALSDTVRTLSIKQNIHFNCIMTSYEGVIPFPALYFQNVNILDVDSIHNSYDILSAFAEVEHRCAKDRSDR